jgi:ATP-binding cassette subfamily B protein
VAVPNNLDSIEVKNLDFTYQGASEPTLHDLTFTVKKGERIALVGHNGAGKTTLVKLLMGLYEPTAGEIRVGGHRVKEYEPKAYRSRFGTVFQDLQVFALSFAENILMRKPQNDDERNMVITAMKKAQLDVPEGGIDAIVSREYDEKGVVLSGGQAQKLAIARVFAQDPAVVILDEPSSALDPISEFHMYENMLQLSENKIVILISHRLSSARLADKIYMLKQGRIIEQGTHDELMDKEGKYAQMFSLQAQNYQESLPDEMEEKFFGKQG